MSSAPRPTGRERIAKTGSWIVRVARREPGDLDAQVEELLSPLSKDLSIWLRLGNIGQTCSLVCSCRNPTKASRSVHAAFPRSQSAEFCWGSISIARVQAEKHSDYRRRRQRRVQYVSATDDEFGQYFRPLVRTWKSRRIFVERVGEADANLDSNAIWERPILKRDVNGIHGTLYSTTNRRRRHLPTSKREVDLDDSSINAPQRRLFAKHR